MRLRILAAFGLSWLLMAVPAAAQGSEPELHVGGALRTNVLFRTWEPTDRETWGLWAFDTLRLNADGQAMGVRFSTEYRFYAGYQMLHHGWIGTGWPSGISLQAGVNQVPFGLLRFASHNWFFMLPYYLGLEDDYDMGLKLSVPSAALGWPLDWHVAFYKSDEGDYTGSSLDSARYSYDVVRTAPGDAGLAQGRYNRETNTFHLRATRTLALGAAGRTELGASLMAGGLYNAASRRMGFRWAGALHADSRLFERLDLKTELLRYGFNPENPPGADGSIVTLGAYDAPYRVAAAANVGVIGLAYRLPFTWGALSEVLVYDDYSAMLKDAPGFSPSQMNVAGMRLTVGQTLIYLDWAAGRNHPWLGPNYSGALAEGAPDESWASRLNLNIGYYF